MKYAPVAYTFLFYVITFSLSLNCMDMRELERPIIDQTVTNIVAPYLSTTFFDKECTSISEIDGISNYTIDPEKLLEYMPKVCKNLPDTKYLQLLVHAHKTENMVLRDMVLASSTMHQKSVLVTALEQCGYGIKGIAGQWKSNQGIYKNGSNLRESLQKMSTGQYRGKPFEPSLIFDAIENDDYYAAFILLLVDKKAVSCSRNLGMTPVHWAAFRNRSAIIQLFYDEGLDSEGKNHFGHTALHIAVGNGNVGSAKCLMANKANPNAQNEYGMTPWLMAKQRQNPVIVKLFEVNARGRGIDLKPFQGPTIRNSRSVTV